MKTIGSLDSLLDRFLNRVEITKPNECWSWLGGRNTKGRAQIGIGKHGMGSMPASRAAVILCGHDPTGKVVRHICDNPLCVNPSHLRIGSQKDNVADAIEKNRFRLGERHRWAKLTNIQMQYAYENPDELRQVDLARLFNVSRQAIWGIQHGKCARKVNGLSLH